MAKFFTIYNPKTMARRINLLCDVTNPPKDENLRNIEANVHAWEEKIKVLSTQFDQPLSNGMKIALFTNMMPADMKDFIFTHVGKKTKSDDLKERVYVLATNKVSMQPAAADVGEVCRPCGSFENNDGTYEEGWPQRQQQHEVDAVGGPLGQRVHLRPQRRSQREGKII